MSDTWCTDVEQGAVLLTVNRRLSRHYVYLHSQAQLAAKRQWWETPGILPLSNWLVSLHEHCVANGSSNVSLLPDIASQRIWQQVVAADDASSVLLDSDLAADNAQRAWAVANAWHCPGVSIGDGSASEDQLAYARWRNAYMKHCNSHNCIDSATLAKHIVEMLKQDPALLQLPKKILLAGFLSIPAQWQNLFTALEENKVVIEFIKPHKQAIKKRVVHADDDVALTAIATEIRSVLYNNPSLQIGVIVHDLQQRRAQVLRAFDGAFFPTLSPAEINAIGRPYDLSMGLPLNEQSLVRTALLFLKLLTNGVTDTELTALLLSPYLPGTESDKRAREELDRQCRYKRLRRVSFYDFIGLLNKGDALRRSLQKISKLKWEKTNMAAVWAEHFGKALRDLGWPGKSIDSEEFQTVEAWTNCLDDFQLLDDGEALTQQRALQLLNALCRSRVFQVQTANTPIQIMGRLESHGLSFNKLWVTGLDSEQWPPVSSPTSFIPIKQQQAAGVPDASPAQRLAMACQEIDLWSESSDELLLCHAQTRNGHELHPASIITDVEAIGQNADAVAGNLLTAARVHDSSTLEAIEDTHGPALEPGVHVKGGTRLLENQARCPFKAFALHRLRIKKLEEAGIGLDPRQHGNLFHFAMEFFWEEVLTYEKLNALSDEEQRILVASVIERSMKENNIEPGLQGLQSRYLNRLINNWLNGVERKRDPFEVVDLEREHEIEISNFTISVKVDRIDKLESGQTVVIDYKTGQSNAIKTWGEPRIENPQLPLYAGTDENVEGICFAQVFPHQNKFIGTTSEDNIVGNLAAPQNHRSLKHSLVSWEHAKEHWAESLNMLGDEVSNGLATITPLTDACRYCELPALCRVSQPDAESEEEADHAPDTREHA